MRCLATMLLTLAVRHCGGALALRRPRAAPAATRWPRALPILRMASDVVPPPQLVDPEPGEEMIKQRAAAAKTGRNSAVVEQKKDQKSETDPLDLKPPRGTRDFYPDEYRIRQWLFSHFRASSRAFGFEEYDAPVLESEALYVRKAGEEVTQQLYSFADKGGRRVALRPEMTPSLARMVLARKPTPPVKWFSIPQCWRYERTTRGRRREHYQWNVDIWGVAGPAAEAEVLACAVDFFRRVGLTEADVGIKVNSRAVLGDMLRTTCGVDPTTEPSRFAACCVLVDKMEKVPPSALYGDFGALGVAADRVDALASLLEQGAAAGGSLQALESLLGADAGALEDLRMLLGLAEAYGFRDWLVVDASIVRGLAYYTGVVFEAFDRAGELRAICGGGRYDRLLELFGGDPQPAVGFGFGGARREGRSGLPVSIDAAQKVDETNALGLMLMDSESKQPRCLLRRRRRARAPRGQGSGAPGPRSGHRHSGLRARDRRRGRRCRLGPRARWRRTRAPRDWGDRGPRPRAQEAQVGLQARGPPRRPGLRDVGAGRVGAG